MWYPTALVIPVASLTNCSISPTRDLTSALHNPSPTSPLSSVTDNKQTALEQLALIFLNSANAQNVPNNPDLPRQHLPIGTLLPRVMTSILIPPPPRLFRGCNQQTTINPLHLTQYPHQLPPSILTMEQQEHHQTQQTAPLLPLSLTNELLFLHLIAVSVNLITN